MEEINRLDHFSNLDVYKPTKAAALTGVICTIGAASRSVPVLEQMMEAGMTIARLVLENNDYEYYAQTIRNIRMARDRYSEKISASYSLAIAVDIRGPEIRIGTVDRSGAQQIPLKKGDTIKLTTEIEYAQKGTNKIIYVDYEAITKFVTRGNYIYLNKGSICLICIGVGILYVNCVIEVGGTLPRYADVRIPNVVLDFPDVSAQDQQDIQFALQQKVNILFVSFVRNMYSLIEIRKLLGKEQDNFVLISKIENLEGVQHIKSILSVSDGILLMRDLLGLEVPAEKIFLVQKSITSICTLEGKPVICATQVLESMMKRNKPSRPEIADIGNAIVDGVDCILLTEETAKGEDPVSYVSHVHQICKEAEAVVWQKGISATVRSKATIPVTIPIGIAISAVEAAEKCDAAAIIVLTTKGRTARLVSQYRPQCPIIAITRNSKVIPRILLYRSVIALYFTGPFNEDWVADVDVMLNFGVKYGVSQKIIKASDMVVAVTTWKHGFDYTSTLRYICANDIIELV